ncbi:MAG: ABC transporter [Gammaproteobacteria bacterium BRH_c0]|nr:MAG: ABC transporter [Gammaproteobacteria bacterium BRH_c0]
MIEANNLQKSFKLYHQPSDRLKEILLRRPFHNRHHALQDVSFRVENGETLGIIGRNGAGKSTLLKILNGVLLPDTGSLHSSGKVTGLLELGTGFDMSMNGEKNIYTNGLLIGMSREELDARHDDIIAFSELGKFINEPLRTYSSGMVMRLAFSIAIHANPDIFLVDEALSVGDGHFQQKCMRKIREFRANGGSIIFVSHDLNAVKMLCDRVIVLSDGKVAKDSDPETAANFYYQILGNEEVSEEDTVVERGYGNHHAEITSVTAMGETSQCEILASGDTLLLTISITAWEDIPDLTAGLTLRDRFGQDIFGTNTHFMEKPLSMSRGDEIVVRFHVPMMVAPGKYTVSIALHEGADHTRICYHWWDNAARFEVSGIRGTHFIGVCQLNPSVEFLAPPEVTNDTAQQS